MHPRFWSQLSLRLPVQNAPTQSASSAAPPAALKTDAEKRDQKAKFEAEMWRRVKIICSALRMPATQLAQVQERLPKYTPKEQMDYLKRLQEHYKQRQLRGDVSTPLEKLYGSAPAESASRTQSTSGMQPAAPPPAEEDGILPMVGDGSAQTDMLDEQAAEEESIEAKRPVFSEYQPMKASARRCH
jgi:hypothetical protein